MNRPKHPCKKDCPDRWAECKKTCPKWKEYEPLLREFYKERAEAYDREYIQNEIERDRKRKIATGKMWRSRRTKE